VRQRPDRRPGTVDLDDLWVAYQPILDLQDSSVVAVETLLRSCSDRRPGATAELIARAEGDGSIHELGRSVLLRACEDAATWSSAGEPAPQLMVNLSALQLHGGPFVDEVVETLDRTGLDAGRLAFELTESHPLTQTAQVTLQALASVGVGVAMDDFGTGFGSLNELRQLPLTGVKIDKRFVAGLPNPIDVAFIKAIKDLADVRDLWCVAEGVETAVQRRALQRAGVRYGQGFGLSMPLDADGVRRFIAAHRRSGSWGRASSDDRRQHA
jgi:EAL domain-containing protein (putative c-di-GMP-specific phosphodiesterase class I)